MVGMLPRFSQYPISKQSQVICAFTLKSKQIHNFRLQSKPNENVNGLSKFKSCIQWSREKEHYKPWLGLSGNRRALSFCIIDSEPWLHIKATWEDFENPNAHTASQTKAIKLSRDGVQLQYFLKALRWLYVQLRFRTTVKTGNFRCLQLPKHYDSKWSRSVTGDCFSYNIVSNIWNLGMLLTCSQP